MVKMVFDAEGFKSNVQYLQYSVRACSGRRFSGVCEVLGHDTESAMGSERSVSLQSDQNINEDWIVGLRPLPYSGPSPQT